MNNKKFLIVIGFVVLVLATTYLFTKNSDSSDDTIQMSLGTRSQIGTSQSLEDRPISDDNTDYLYLDNIKQHATGDTADLPTDEDYVLINKMASVNSEVNIAMVGYASDTKFIYFTLELLDKNFNPGLGRSGYIYDGLTTIDAESASLTLQDIDNISQYIALNNVYPTSSEIQLNGIVPYEKYKELFDQFPLDGRDVIADGNEIA